MPQLTAKFILQSNLAITYHQLTIKLTPALLHEFNQSVLALLLKWGCGVSSRKFLLYFKVEVAADKVDFVDVGDPINQWFGSLLLHQISALKSHTRKEVVAPQIEGYPRGCQSGDDEESVKNQPCGKNYMISDLDLGLYFDKRISTIKWILHKRSWWHLVDPGHLFWINVSGKNLINFF